MKLEKLLDELNEYIYITDIETRELLFVNRAGLNYFQYTDWHVFEGRACIYI